MKKLKMLMKKNITILDIAKDCGVSKSTVAYALSDSASGKVAPEKRRLIKQAADRLGYRANLAAKGLSSRKSFAIGVLLPSPKDNFYGDMVAEIQHLLSNTSYTPVFAFWETVDSIRKAADSILSRKVDAIITCEPSCLPDNLNIPVVSYYNPDPRFDYVGFCPEETTLMRLDYLLELGHRKIGYIGPEDDFRFKEFSQLIKTKGIINFPEWNQYAKDSYQENFAVGAASFEKIWQYQERPTAIMTNNDSIAIGVIRKAHELGVALPGDLSLIGFDDIRHASYCIPSLTTISKGVDQQSITQVIIDMVFARMQKSTLPRREHMITPKLIIRESTGKAV